MDTSYCLCEGQYFGVIQNLIDNELNREEEKRIRAFIAHNKCAKACYEELVRQKELLKRWWADRENI